MNLQKFKHVIVDVSNLYHRNYSVHSEMTYNVRNAPIVTGGIYGSILSVLKLKNDFLEPDGTLWLIFDNSTSKINLRKELYAEYKANRVKKSPSFYKGIDYFRLIMMNFDNSFKVVTRSAWEADDLVKPVILNLPKEDTILIASEDMDWSRMLKYEGRPVYWFAKKKVYEPGMFEDEYGFYPTESNIVLYKSFRGDPADNIPNAVPGIPKKILVQLMENYKKVEDIIKDLPVIDYVNDNWKQKIIAGSHQLRINQQLVSFIGLGREVIDEFIFDSKFNPKSLKVLYETLGFNIFKLDARVSQYMKKCEAIKNKEKFDDWFSIPTPERA